MTTVCRKSARALKRLTAILGDQALAAKPGHLEVQGVPGPVEAAVIASAPVYPVCPVCAVAAGIRETADILNGHAAGECMACGALRLLD